MKLTPHQSAALQYKKHISLTANAGSGKTLVLSKRYLEIALNEGIPLRQIAAITFTDKAAGELYKKIAGEIENKLLSAAEPGIISRLENIRRQLVSANISTIHSFCIGILREFPVEADIDANFIPIDEKLADELIELSVEEVIRNALNNPGDAEEVKYLVRVFASRKKFSLELISLLKNRKNIIDLADKIYSDTKEEIAKVFYRSFLELAEEIFLSQGRKESIAGKIREINNIVLRDNPGNERGVEVKHLLDQLGRENLAPEETLMLLRNSADRISTDKNTIRVSGYLNRHSQSLLEKEIEEIENFFYEFRNMEITADHHRVELELARFGKSIIRFFNLGLNLYEEKKKQNGYLDFEDLLLYTRKILSGNEVKKSLSEKFRYIMVDEYQDTNEIQYQIFLPLLDNLRKGNLFVVGDEKQSIYMFRDAELEVFSETIEDIESNAGEKLTLPDSFRMAPALCCFINHLFGKLFERSGDLFNEVGHSDLICARGEDPAGEIEILAGDEESSKNTEALLVAKRIYKLKTEKNLRWNDIAVLVRKRKSFAELESVFLKYKIPFNIVGGTGFYQQQTIYDIYNYFSFLLDKGNDTALAGILRSPFFSLSDPEILSISLEKEKTLWKKLKLFSRKHAYLNKSVELLRENLTLGNSIDTAAMLRKILSETGYISVAAAKINGAQELANLDKLIRMTTGFNLQGFKTLYDYVTFLKDSIRKIEDEAQAAVADESESVKVMTIHQAKGLEYQAVFLYNTDDTSQKDNVKTKSVSADKKLGLLTKVPLDGNYFSEYRSAPVICIHNLISEKKNFAEIKRLFYVGLTRAVNYLFISAPLVKNHNYRKDSFMGLLSGCFMPDFESESFTFSHNLTFLKKNGEGFLNETRKMNIKVPVIRELEEPVIEISAEKKEAEKIIKTEIIEDIPEGEIFSATKLGVYKECPLKYKLLYESGFSSLMGRFNEWRNRESLGFTRISADEDDLLRNNTVGEEEKFFSPDIKGRIIHKILQGDPDPSAKVKEELKNIIRREINSAGKGSLSADGLSSFEDDISRDIENYLSSPAYSSVKSFKNYSNEFEIYTREKDYFLYGIIDKLIFDGDTAIIVDYKTDDIDKTEIPRRAYTYLNQLKFYSYIISRLFKNISTFELRLIFIKHPGEFVPVTLNYEEVKEFGLGISEIVSSVRNNEFIKNPAHCPKCIFAVNRTGCIVN